jgi:hypothetical protein
MQITIKITTNANNTEDDKKLKMIKQSLGIFDDLSCNQPSVSQDEIRSNSLDINNDISVESEPIIIWPALTIDTDNTEDIKKIKMLIQLLGILDNSPNHQSCTDQSVELGPVDPITPPWPV